MHKLVLSCLAAALTLVAAAHPARAAFTLTLQQVGTSVVFTGAGTINTTALTLYGKGNSASEFAASAAYVFMGLPANNGDYMGLTGPDSFNPGSAYHAILADSATGDPVALFGVNHVLGLAVGYVSGSPLANTATYNNATLASLGFIPGTYTYTWGSGATADSLIVTGGVVPEPSTWALLGAGAGLLACGAVRCRRAQAV